MPLHDFSGLASTAKRPKSLSRQRPRQCPIPGFGPFRKTPEHIWITTNKTHTRMTRKNVKPPKPDEHLETLGELLSQLRTHLTASAEKKGTYGDYLRLLEFYRDTRDEQAREIVIRWVDDETQGTEPLP